MFSLSGFSSIALTMLSLEYLPCVMKLKVNYDFWSGSWIRGTFGGKLYWLCQSLWLCGSQQTGKFWKRWEYQTSWEICKQVEKQQFELDMEQQTGSKLGKEYVKAVYCHPAYLTSMQSTSCKMLGCMKHKLESRMPGEISITSHMQVIPPLCRKWRRTKEPLMKVKEESEKAGLKLNVQKLRSWHLVPPLHGK